MIGVVSKCKGEKEGWGEEEEEEEEEKETGSERRTSDDVR